MTKQKEAALPDKWGSFFRLGPTPERIRSSPSLAALLRHLFIYRTAVIDNIITVVFSEQDIEKMNNAIALLNEVISHKI